MALYGTARQANDGTAAHLWQLLMACQVPVAAGYAVRWLPQYGNEWRDRITRGPRPAPAIAAAGGHNVLMF